MISTARFLLITITLFLLIGTASADLAWTSASGCWTATNDSHTFVMWNATGSSTWNVPTGVTSVDYLVVAGGGGGGGYTAGGGGGGQSSTGTGLSITPGSIIGVAVGSGGTGGLWSSSTAATYGVNSSFGTIESFGGSFGGSFFAGGYAGGSRYNGGGSSFTSAGGDGSNYDGGSGAGAGAEEGGGGAGQGGDGVAGNVAKTGGQGGSGITSYITGTPLQVSGGGGGSTDGTAFGAGGGTASYGGGAGSASTTGTAGSANTGGGGGGSGSTDTSGGSGGSGIVIISYATPLVASFTPLGVVTANNKITQAFTDTSVGNPTTWNWSYQGIVAGNNTPVIWSTTQNPTGTFGVGNFSIKLNTTNSYGFNVSTQSTWINVTSLIFYANSTLGSTYGFPVKFTDAMESEHVAWLWEYGDGYTSTDASPTHYYSVANRYTVNLTTTDAFAAVCTTSRLDYINLTSDLPNVKSWMHMDGADGGTTFADLLGNAWTPTSVTTNTANKKFGTASATFNANGDRLLTASSPAFDFGTGDFTIEFQVYPTLSRDEDFIITRTTSGETKPDGWGIYHSSASATSDAWKVWFGTTAVQTDAFTIPLNQWNHVAVERVSGVVTVYVNGVAVTTPLAAAGDYDTANPIVYGRPAAGGGVNSARMALDETRVSNTARWLTAFSPPPAPYAGDLFPTIVDPNPGSTLRFKTDPPAQALISNVTARNRTVQIQYVNITNNISATITWDPTHLFVSGVTPNTTMFADTTFTATSIDNTLGQATINATRPGGFSTNGLTGDRGSFADLRTVYWNYSEPSADQTFDYFGNGYLGNLTTGIDYPIHNFIATNVTYEDWVTFSNFSVSDTSPIISETAVVFVPTEMNQTANRWLWDYGDGITFLSTNITGESHIYTGVPATYSPSLTAYLYQNSTVTNTTTRTGLITTVWNTSYINADFSADPTAGTPGVAVVFTDLSAYGDTTGLVYNWSFGDNLYSATPYSDIVGNVTHVYPSVGTYTVNLTVSNIHGSDSEVKLNYIVVSSSQLSTTFYSPKTTAFHVVDLYGNQIQGAEVKAVFNQTTLPDSETSWLITNYGMNAQAAGEATVLSMSGTTSSTGDITFVMIAPLEYDVEITYGGTTNYFSISPQNYFYQLKFLEATGPDTSIGTCVYANGNTYTGIARPDIGNITLMFSYQDTCGKTVDIDYYVVDNDLGTEVYHYHLTPVTTGIYVNNYTVPNVRGKSYRWWQNSTRDV